MTTTPTPPAAPGPEGAGRGDELRAAVGVLALLVALMVIGATVYLCYQHPRLTGPLGAGGTVGVLLVAVIPIVYRRR